MVEGLKRHLASLQKVKVNLEKKIHEKSESFDPEMGEVEALFDWYDSKKKLAGTMVRDVMPKAASHKAASSKRKSYAKAD